MLYSLTFKSINTTLFLLVILYLVKNNYSVFFNIQLISSIRNDVVFFNFDIAWFKITLALKR